MPIIRTLLCFGLLLSQLGPARAETLDLRYGQTASTLRSAFSLPIVIAEREGFFTQEGLRLTVVPIAGGTDNMIAELNKGAVDVTHVSTPFLVSAVLAGSDAAAIAAEFNNPIYSLVAKPDIKTFAELKGKLVGLAVAADTIAISTRKLMALHGVKSGDVRVKEMQGTPARFACLQSGECDAVPLGQPQDFLALAAGNRLLGLSSEAVPDFLYTVTAARRSWAQSHRDAVIRYVRALAAAFRFIRDPEKRENVIQTLVETTDSTAPIARQTMSLYLDPERGVLPRQGEINLAGLSQVIDFMREAGSVRDPLPAPERFVDLQYLRAAGLQ